MIWAGECVESTNSVNDFFLIVQPVECSHVGSRLVFRICHLDTYKPGADCTISIRYPRGDLKEPQPLILKRDNGNMSFLYPENNDDILRIRANNTIYLACPGKNNYLKNVNWGNEAEAACIQDKLFYVKGGVHDFTTLVCAKSPADSARNIRLSNFVCKHNPVEIGFNVANTFVRIIEICRDNRTYNTYYTKFHLTKHIGSFQNSYPRPQFKQGNFYPYGANVDNLYKFDTQNETFTKILGSPVMLKGKLQKSVQFVARGHMAAKTDFVYGSQQNSTFWFINVAPQWQTFNNGNWKLLENSIRNLANNRRLGLDIYTGVYGQMTMEDTNGIQQPLYLYPERNALSVPKYFWKVVYDPSNKLGTAFVGLNDPFVHSIANVIYLCKDVTNKITWLNWLPTNITAGISYACTVNELRRSVPEVPKLYVTGLLK